VPAFLIAGRTILRRGPVVTVLLGVLIALAGAATIAAVAGARRTATAYPRLVEETNAADVQVSAVVRQIDLDAVEQLPQVTKSGGLLAFDIPPVGPGGVPLDGKVAGGFASADGRLYYEIERPQILEGRLPHRDRVDEVLINQAMSDDLELEIGDPYKGVLFDYGALEEFAESGRPPEELDLETVQTPVEFEVVGISRGQAEIIPAEGQRSNSVLFLGPAFAERYAGQEVADSLVVNLRRGERDLAAFKADVRALFPDAGVEFPSKVGKLETVERSVRPYSGALYLFAVVVGVTAFLVIGQIVARQVALDARDVPVFRAMGMSPLQCLGAVLLRSAVIAVAGALVAVLIAALASGLFPFGPAGLAEPDPGIRIDGLVLALGLLLTIVLVLGRAAVSGWWVIRRQRAAAVAPQGRARPSAVVVRLARSGFPTAPATGVRFALERRGALAGPVTTLVGLVAAVVAVTVTLGFNTSLDRVTSTPHLYGWNWDVLLEGYDGTTDAISDRAERDDGLTAKTNGARTTVSVEGEDLLVFAVARGTGKLQPTIIDGRLPKGDDEVALGAESMRSLGRARGDDVTVRGSGGARNRLRVVGTAVLPVLTLGETVGLADGAVLTLDGLRELDPGLEPSFIAADLARGTTLDDIRDRYDEHAAVNDPHPPTELQSYQRVDNLPGILAVVLAGLGGGVLSHALVTSIRRRRREVAVLKTLGFVRPQVGIAVISEATTLVALGLLIGLPLGLVVARWAWTAFANQLGVVAEPVVPFPFGIMGIALVALVLANAVAAFPGRSAARTRPGVALRAE